MPEQHIPGLPTLFFSHSLKAMAPHINGSKNHKTLYESLALLQRLTNRDIVGAVKADMQSTIPQKAVS
jgi:hypothetical protein